MNNKGADQTADAQAALVVCAFVVCKPLKTGFLASRPIFSFKYNYLKSFKGEKVSGYILDKQ